MPEIDFYKTLGVARNASADDIRKAYKKLAQISSRRASGG